MTLRYVFSELRAGLRRNLTMHLAVVLTLFVSLTLAGCGILVQRETKFITETLGHQLQLTVYLCTDVDAKRPDRPNCSGGEATQAQQNAVLSAIKSSPDVDDVTYVSKKDGYEKAIRTMDPKAYKGPNPAVTVATWPAAYWVQLKDPEHAAGVKSAVEGLPGVEIVPNQDKALSGVYQIMRALRVGSWISAVFLLLAALLEVANTIRLAALARRREIEIMRLVGASTLYIATPFLLEALVTAVVGVCLASLALAGVQQWGIQGALADNIHFLPWIDWSQWLHAIFGIWPPGIAWLGPILTLVPTLLLTRKYIKV